MFVLCVSPGCYTTAIICLAVTCVYDTSLLSNITSLCYTFEFSNNFWLDMDNHIRYNYQVLGILQLDISKEFFTNFCIPVYRCRSDAAVRCCRSSVDGYSCRDNMYSLLSLLL
jgi:hypothetical protein